MNKLKEKFWIVEVIATMVFVCLYIIFLGIGRYDLALAFMGCAIVSFVITVR